MLSAGVGLLNLLPIATERLTLRRFHLGDLEAFMSYRSDPEVGRYQGWSPMSESEARAFVDEQARQPFGRPGEWLQIALALKDTDRLVGDIGAHTPTTGLGTVEIGYTLARGEWGRGYATEAVRAFLEAVFERTPIRQCEATADARNMASIALLGRLGFSRDRVVETVFRDQPCIEHVFLLRKPPSW